MSTAGFVDRSKPKTQPQSQPPTAAEILLQVEAKRASVLTLQAQIYSIVERTTFDAAANRRYEELVAETAVLNADIAKLEAAFAKLQHSAKVTAVSESAAARRDKAAAFTAHAERSLELVGEIAAGLEQATAAIAKFYHSCREMTASAPVNLPMDTAAFDFMINDTTIQLHLPMALAAEMHRLADLPALRLPGSKSPLIQTSGQPGAIEPIVAARQRVTDYLIAHMRTALDRLEAKETETLV
jgi:hypothetical protein